MAESPRTDVATTAGAAVSYPATAVAATMTGTISRIAGSSNRAPGRIYRAPRRDQPASSGGSFGDEHEREEHRTP
jgi:hypothetical protein